MSLGGYVAGDSPLHRLAAGWKLAGLAMVGSLALVGAGPMALAGAFPMTILIAWRAGLRPAWLLRQMQGLLPILGAILAFHLINGSPRVGATSVLGIGLAVLAAIVVTATTRMSDMIEAFQVFLRPLARVGANPEMLALMLALALRLIPSVLDDLRGLQDARRARGARGFSVSLLAPLIIASLRRGEELAQAMEARGHDGRAAATPASSPARGKPLP